MADFEIQTEFDKELETWHWKLLLADGSPRATSGPLKPEGYKTEAAAKKAAQAAQEPASRMVVVAVGADPMQADGWVVRTIDEAGETVEETKPVEKLKDVELP